MAIAGFVPVDDAEVARLLAGYPFAWVVTAADGDFAATLLPIRPVRDSGGRIVELHGHFARRNPQVEMVRRTPRALVLFLGPHDYISSSWLTDRTRTPTWNYASAQFFVDIEFFDDAQQTEALLRDLVGAMEDGRPGKWSVDEMGPRYARIVGGIIGFHAPVREIRAKFKLGQDERPAEYAEILAALDAGGGSELADWMRRNNPGR